MALAVNGRLLFVLSLIVAKVTAQQQCYFGPGAANRGPSSLVPCLGTGTSACCLLGDTCLSGNTCYNYSTGDLYQYGCTDITYKDSSCPYKCGWNTTLSPWVALEYCADVPGVNNTFVCHSPESCGCDWTPSQQLLVLQPRGCKEMGTDARVALYAPSTLAPYVSLPTAFGGSTSYYSPTTISGTSTWISTAIAGYTPSPITQLTHYRDGPSSVVVIQPGVSPSPSTVAAPSIVAATVLSTFIATRATSSSSSTTSSSSSTTSSSSSATPSSANASPFSNGTTTSSTTASDSGLSAGAKAGIGGGVAGGVLLLAAVAIAAFLWGKLQRRRKAAETQQADPSQDPQHPQSPPMQQSAPFYPSPGEKPPGWQPTYPNYPYQQAPFYDPHQPSPYIHETQPYWLSTPSPPLEITAPQRVSMSPPLPPMELPAERRVHEMGSLSSSSPAPAYAEGPRTP